MTCPTTNRGPTASQNDVIKSPPESDTLRSDILEMMSDSGRYARDLGNVDVARHSLAAISYTVRHTYQQQHMGRGRSEAWTNKYPRGQHKQLFDA